MCGFCGFISSDNQTAQGHTTLRSMNDKLALRGPDSEGMWFDPNDGIALGHRRLSVVELSAAGNQPMQSHDSRFILAFNGEIYNHLDLRKTLGLSRPDISWTGHSDTETLLELISQFGLAASLSMLRGMFAFALWDRGGKCLTLARDRLGEKPLYFGWQGKSLLFASDLAAIKMHPDFRNVVDRRSLNLLLRYNSIPAPYSIFEGISKLEPGAYITFNRSDISKRESPDRITYWSPVDAMKRGKSRLSHNSFGEDVTETEEQIGHAVKRQLMSDVPLGAFLSGGFDSTAIVTQMVQYSTSQVKTFTIGSLNPSEDESQVAGKVARILGTEHTTLRITPDDALEVIPSLPDIYSEPFGDSSQIPTFLVSKLARQSVKVALSGDGGDELFGGYNRYTSAASFWTRSQKLPSSVRHGVSAAITALSADRWNRLFEKLNLVLPKSSKILGGGDKLQKLATIVNADSPQAYYLSLTSDNQNPELLVLGGGDPSPKAEISPRGLSLSDFQEWLMLSDAMGYLPTDILAKVDRAAMANSLETRAPFLDPDLYEYSWTLPMDRKIRNGQGKLVLKEIVYSHLPKELMDRPKQGFGVPIDRWLRGPLMGWAESLLSEDKLKNDGFLNSRLVRSLWERHLSGKENLQHQLWTILMFQAWLDTQERRPS